MANRVSPPAVTLSWAVTCQSLGRAGDFPLHCCRCGQRLVLELPGLLVVQAASCVAATCSGCGVGFSVTLAPPAALRPQIASRPKGGWLQAAEPAEPSPPVAEPVPTPQAAAEIEVASAGPQQPPTTNPTTPKNNDAPPGLEERFHG